VLDNNNNGRNEKYNFRWTTRQDSKEGRNGGPVSAPAAACVSVRVENAGLGSERGPAMVNGERVR